MSIVWKYYGFTLTTVGQNLADKGFQMELESAANDPHRGLMTNDL